MNLTPLRFTAFNVIVGVTKIGNQHARPIIIEETFDRIGAATIDNEIIGFFLGGKTPQPLRFTVAASTRRVDV